MTTLQKLHEIEKKKCIYDIHYCNAGIGFIFYEPRGIPTRDNYKNDLVVDHYYQTFEKAVDAEYKRLK